MDKNPFSGTILCYESLKINPYMTEKTALALIQQYISGWKQNNLALIIDCLTENCVVIESHGPRYHDLHDIEQWFTLWLAAKSRISKWDITSFSFCEWDFACVSNETHYDLSGISVIKFSAEKISFIHEYRMSHPAYKWEGDRLASE